MGEIIKEIEKLHQTILQNMIAINETNLHLDREITRLKKEAEECLNG